MIGKDFVALISLALLASACASSAAPARQSGVSKERAALPSPRGRAEARRQLAYYIAQLESGRRALGIGDEYSPRRERLIAPAVPAAPSTGGAPSAGASDAAESAPAAKRSRPRRAPRSRVSAAPLAAPPAPSADDAGGAPPRARCPMACRHARAICDAARHICKLADYLDEDDARIRCGQAQEDCRRARERTRGQCHACD